MPNKKKPKTRKKRIRKKKLEELHNTLLKKGFALTDSMISGQRGYINNKCAELDKDSQYFVRDTNYFYRCTIRRNLKGPIKCLEVGSNGVNYIDEILAGKKYEVTHCNDKTDVWDLSFEDDLGMIAFTYNALGRLPEEKFQDVFNSMYAALKHGGLVCIDVLVLGIEDKERIIKNWGFTEDDVKEKNYMAFYPRDSKGIPICDDKGVIPIYTERFFTASRMLNYAKNAGFGVIATKKVEGKGWHPPVYAMVLQKPVK